MYIPLYNKSNYTLLSSMLKIDDIIEYAKKNSLKSISLVDTNMFGTMEFIKKCEIENIKPVIGLEVNYENLPIVLFIKNENGYKNLIKISTIQNERNVLKEDLEQHKKDLIVVVPYQSKELFETINSIYLECYQGYRNKLEEKESLERTNKVVFFQENLYRTKKDQEYLNILYKIRDGKTLLDEDSYQLENHELEIEDINSYSSKENLETSSKILEECNLILEKNQNYLPIYDCNNPNIYLEELCKVGLKKRLSGNIPIEYQNRLVYECKVIEEMGFSNYFLIVYDFIKFAKKNQILVGPGRGSAAGSLVAYCLGITDIDPLKYDLLFERFLNPERKTMPDIDTDFPDDKRDFVIDYVKEKYGEKRVSGIITFGTMAAKQVIRDVSRVLNIPLYKVDSLSKFIPPMSKDKLIDIYNKNEAFKVRIESDTILSNMFRIATHLEGFPRHTSSHAAGIIMSRVDLDEVIPLIKVDNLYLTSYSMEYLEELGLLKMDFLVLKNLTMIDNILKDIKTINQEEVIFSNIPLDDKETLSLFEKADTTGIFQFESTGMKSFLKRLKPNTFEDIVAAIALFRPGAALNIDSYIKRKHQEEEITYLDSSLEEITKSTYGFLIYQEQIIKLANIYAGYTLGEADILRRAMSKKKLELLQKEEKKFIEKSMSNNHTYEQSKKIFDLILKFAGYGFNKSHSVAYSIVSYKMAYLKCHYKTIFYKNLLTGCIGSEEKTSEYIKEAKKNHIEIRKPTIEESGRDYIVKKNTIYYPISNIKGIGMVGSTQIEKAKEKGPFLDIFDCFSRLYIEGVGKKTLETLIYANVFSSFSYTRATLIYNLDNLINYVELTKDIDPSLVEKPDLVEQLEFSNEFLLEKEKELFGFYLSHHPTTAYQKENPNCIYLNTIEEYFNREIDCLVLVEKLKVIKTKKGEEMAFLTGSDETTTKEFTLFPRVYQLNRNLEKGNIIKVRGTVEKRLNEYQIVVKKIELLQGDNHEEEK